MPTEQICTIAAVTRLSKYAYHFVLECGDMAGRITPGQFLHIKCGEEHLLRRPISICEWQKSEPEDLVSIVFEVRGQGTAWLSARKAGDKLDVLGPLGHGFEIQREGKYLLVGGGIGVPPLLGCCTKGSAAVLGFRSAERAMPLLLRKFKEYGGEVRVTSDDGTLGPRGFVDGPMRALLAAGAVFDAVLACGPRPMLKSVARVAAEYQIPCQVSMEERMGCGVGACLVCACQAADGTMKHVCKDGPVFNATEVDWNV